MDADDPTFDTPQEVMPSARTHDTPTGIPVAAGAGGDVTPPAPALTADGWKQGVAMMRQGTALISCDMGEHAGSVALDFPCDHDTHLSVLTPPERHALAALALHQQPFGFTWQDVDDLREAATLLDEEWGDGAANHIRQLASRIAALLPPRP